MKLSNKLLIIAILSIFIFSYSNFNISLAQSKTMYTNNDVSNMTLAGTNRGNWQDRQNLGIYMPAGSSFKIRQINTNLNQNLTLDCYNNDSQTEKTYTINKNGEWTQVSVDSDSVPFIRTIYNTSEKPQIEISEENGTQELTYYYYGDNQENFLKKWKDNNQSYAVIENDRVTFLVPIKNKDQIITNNKTNYTFSTIDEMLKYYSDFIEQYDKYIGLSYNTTESLNQNTKTKFFIKANKHWAGAAAYSNSYIAQNGDNISSFLTRGWLSLHEVGHGYTGSLANQELSIGEVANNILGHYFQQTFLSEGDYGWLGKKLDIEKDIATARNATTTFNELTYRQKLYMFVNLLDKIGPEKSMANAHQTYRKYLSQGIQYTASDLFAEAFSKSSKFNVIPYLESWKITTSNNVKSQIYEEELPMIYYLRNLVSSDEKAEKIRTELALDGNYALVSNSDIEKYNMTGNATINIAIDQIEQIKGKKIYIKDGSKIVKEATINEQTIKIEDIPVGIYTIELPNTKTEAYKYDYQYIIIQENNTIIKDIDYTKITFNPLISDTEIILNGLGDAKFATLSMNLENGTMEINSLNTQPHVYFTDEYANIEIIDKDGKQVYKKSYLGNIASASDDTIKIEYGYKIKIKHREAKGRLKLKSQILNENEDYGELTENTTWTITKYGLQRDTKTEAEQYEIFKTKLAKYINETKEKIPTEKQKNKYNYFIEKNNILSAILSLDENDKIEYLKEQNTLTNGSSPEIEDIQDVEFTQGDELRILLSTFDAQDLEDGKIELTSKNVKVKAENMPVDENKLTVAGTYNAAVTITDSDNNSTTKMFRIVVRTKQTNTNTMIENNTTENNTTVDNQITTNTIKNDTNTTIANNAINNTIVKNEIIENTISNETNLIKNETTNDNIIINNITKDPQNAIYNKVIDNNLNTIITDNTSNKDSQTIVRNNNIRSAKTDLTQAIGKLPQTGENTLIIIAIILLITISIWQYAKMRINDEKNAKMMDEKLKEKQEKNIRKKLKLKKVNKNNKR